MLAFVALKRTLCNWSHAPRRFCAASIIVLAAPFSAHAQLNPAVLPSEGALSKQTISRLMLTDATRSGNRVIAVGDRGYVVFSDSNGESWERAKTPDKLPMLTSVSMAGEKTVWAVGHDSTVLRSVDQGKTWEKAYTPGKELAALMDVLFLDANTGFAVGSYGTFMATTDGGKTWEKRKVIPSAPVAAKPVAAGRGGGRAAAGQDAGDDLGKGADEDRHLNAIVNLGDGKLLIVGEAGMALKSDDSGKSWTKVATPYKGSFFGAIKTDAGAVVVYGLRGNVFSVDASLKNWTPVATNTKASFMGAAKLADGAIALVGLSGTVLLSRDGGKTFAAQSSGTTKALSSVAIGGSNSLLLFGESGVRDLVVPSAK